MTRTRLTCSADPAHLSVQIDMSDAPSLRTMAFLVETGCPSCKQPLLVLPVAQGYSSETERYSTSDPFMSVPTQRMHSSTSGSQANSADEMEEAVICGTIHADPKKLKAFNVNHRHRTKGEVSSHISQVLPLRAALDVLAAELISRESDSVPLRTFVKPVEQLQLLRKALIDLEIKHGQTKRGNRPHAGFPIHPEEDSNRVREKGQLKSLDIRNRDALTSWSRFFNTVFGGLRKGGRDSTEGTPYGALFDMGWAQLEDIDGVVRIGLTEEGIALAGLPNPLLHRTDMMSITAAELKLRFSFEEVRQIWKSTVKHRKTHVEGDVLLHTIRLISEGELHVLGLMEQLAEFVSYVDELTPDAEKISPRRGYVSSFMGRWTGLGLFLRTKPGTYAIAPLYAKIKDAREVESTWKKNRTNL